MKIKEIWNWIKKVTQPKKQERITEKEDPYAMIKHKTKSLGFRHHKAHNCRRKTRGRNIQYVTLNGRTKPIYHIVIQ